MKVISAMLAMTVVALAGPGGDPGAAAVHFLEKVRSKSLNLDPGGDTALAPQTSAQKRREITRRLERLARDLGPDQLEVGAVKFDDDLAAVLVHKAGGFDPSQFQVFPVALVKRGTEWAAAPVPASFENSGVGYAALLRKRLSLLEDWMLRQQALDLENLRDQAAERLRRKIEEELPAATLRKFTPIQTAARFLTACERRNLPELLGLLGGLSDSLPNDWPQCLQAAAAAVSAAAEVKRPWRLLMAAEVLRVRVGLDEDGGRATVTFACLDPAAGQPRTSLPRVELVRLELAKLPDGLWRIELPGNFLQDAPAPEEVPEEAPGEDADSDLLDGFPASLARLCPASPGSSAEQARTTLLATLQSGSPAALMRLIRLDGDPAAARRACARACQLWWALREPSTVRAAVPLAWQQAAASAAQACQFFSARNPDRLDLKILYFDKSPDGWYWTPEARPEIEKSLHDWSERQSQQWQNQWQQELLTECPVLAGLPDAGAPAEAPARQLIESWLRAVHAGDVMAALRLTARLSAPDSTATLLRNLGYEMTGARRNRRLPTLTGIHSGGIWTAVGTRSAPGEALSCPLYPVVVTPAGPRILLEIDLVASGNRSRDFLNKTALERLRKASASAAESLQQLFAEHQARLAPPPAP